jgi:hypothetical protein
MAFNIKMRQVIGLLEALGQSSLALTNINFSAGTTSNNLSKIVFSNSNGLSFGLNGSTITASYTVPAGGNPGISGSNGSFTYNTVTFGNLNGLSFYTSNGSMVGSHNGLTTAMQSDAGSNFVNTSAGLNLTNISATFNSNSISLSVNAGGSPNFSAGTTSNNLNSVIFSNSNGLSFGLDGSTITASKAAQWLRVNNTTQTNLSSLHIFSTLLAGYNNVQLSATTQTDGAATVNMFYRPPAYSAANGTLFANTLTFADSNGVSFSTGTQGVYATVATNYLTTARASNDAIGLNTAQTNVTWTVNSSGLSLNAAGYAGTGTTFNGANLSGSITQNSNGINLSLSAAAPSAQTVSYYAMPADGWAGGTATTNWFQSTSVVAPFNLQQNLSIGSVGMILSGSMAASSTQATTGNTSLSAGITTTRNIVIYSRGAGANSLSLQYVTSTQVLAQQAITWSVAANSTQHSVSNRVTYGTYSGTFDYSSSVTRFDYHTSNLTGLSGLKQIFVPFGISLPPGQYWLAIGGSTSFATQAASVSVMTRMLVSFTSLAISQNTLALGNFGGATSSSIMWQPGLGSFSIGGVGGTTSSVDMNNISSNVSNLFPHIKLMRIT